jgi:hypothetical protein
MTTRTRTVLLRFPVDLPNDFEVSAKGEKVTLNINLKTYDIVTYRGPITVKGITYNPELYITGTRNGLLSKLSIHSCGKELFLDAIPEDVEEWGQGVSRVLETVIDEDLNRRKL